MMTGSQMRREREEFKELLTKHSALEAKRQIAYHAYTSKDKQMSATGDSITGKGANCIEVQMTAFDWKPDRLLLLRFGL